MSTSSKETRKRIVSIVAAVFILAEAALFFLIQITSGGLYEILAYLSVGLSFGFSLLSLLCGFRGMLLRLGLATTLVADYFLILAVPVNEEAGVFVFSLVQMCYFAALMLCSDSVKERVLHISARLSLVALMAIVAVIILADEIDLLVILTIFYYGNLLCNIVFAFVRLPYGIMFALGLLLLALCDLFLGLGFLGTNYLGATEGSFLYLLTHLDLNIPWLFYVPSCTLIALSTFSINRKV